MGTTLTITEVDDIVSCRGASIRGGDKAWGGNFRRGQLRKILCGNYPPLNHGESESEKSRASPVVVTRGRIIHLDDYTTRIRTSAIHSKPQVIH